MENSKDITLESVLTAFDVMLVKSAKEFDRRLEDSHEKFKQRLEDSDEKFRQRLEDSHEEFKQEMKQSREEFDRRQVVLDEKLKILTEQVTGVSKSNGLFAEDYFFNSFKKDDINFFGERFDKVVRGRGTVVEDEYDFVLINGKTAGIVEVKYKARRDDIQKALKKVNTFRINFPEYKNHKIYLAIAALTINKTLELECNKQGIAVIKQVGDKVIVYDKHLKVF